jgi:hypothetical protein
MFPFFSSTLESKCNFESKRKKNDIQGRVFNLFNIVFPPFFCETTINQELLLEMEKTEVGFYFSRQSDRQEASEARNAKNGSREKEEQKE